MWCGASLPHITGQIPGDNGPSWLTFLGHTKDSLWSIDLFRCESILLKSHWVLVVMDQFTRRIIGFGVHAGDVDGIALCRMFNTAISSRGVPKYLSSDNDPLFLYHQWQANLRILGADEVKTVPYTPLSHPFVERLIGTIRREYLDHTLFWNASDLERKLEEFRQYYNAHRVHTSLDGDTPSEISGETIIRRANLNQFRWKSHCRGLFQLPVSSLNNNSPHTTRTGVSPIRVNAWWLLARPGNARSLSRDQQFPLSRSAPHLGELARHEWHQPAGVNGAGWLEVV